ncbi:MAG: alkaline phosphatase [Saprospiraceae bacterium]|nr:alkaline phosphatase [Saprospiraceae bacterium]
MIGDGMGLSHIFAAMTANKNHLYIENFKHIGFSKTQSADNYVTDSGASGTAMACGVKTYNGAIGVDMNKKPLKSILKYAEDNGKATGLVATSSITHATPASFIANNISRNNYEEIAADFLKTDIDLFIGGGRDNFEKRKDGKNLTNELKEKSYSIVYNLTDLQSLNQGKVAALLYDAHCPKMPKRGNMLEVSTKKAIEILNQDEDGFFLMIEGSQIDWGGHLRNQTFIINEIFDMDKALGIALEFAAKNKETLIIVTADHETGGLSVNDGNMKTGDVKTKFSTSSHTGLMVPVFAIGPGAEKFEGIYENTEIFDKMMVLFEFSK